MCVMKERYVGSGNEGERSRWFGHGAERNEKDTDMQIVR